jgi:hypothetical protein
MQYLPEKDYDLPQLDLLTLLFGMAAPLIEAEAI